MKENKKPEKAKRTIRLIGKNIKKDPIPDVNVKKKSAQQAKEPGYVDLVNSGEVVETPYDFDQLVALERSCPPLRTEIEKMVVKKERFIHIVKLKDNLKTEM